MIEYISAERSILQHPALAMEKEMKYIDLNKILPLSGVESMTCGLVPQSPQLES